MKIIQIKSYSTGRQGMNVINWDQHYSTSNKAGSLFLIIQKDF